MPHNKRKRTMSNRKSKPMKGRASKGSLEDRYQSYGAKNVKGIREGLEKYRTKTEKKVGASPKQGLGVRRKTGKSYPSEHTMKKHMKKKR